MQKKVVDFFKQDMLFTISFFLAAVSCLFGSFDVSFIDYKVILSLFGLMLVIKVFERVGVLGYFAEKLVQVSGTNRALVRNMTFLSFFASMILTNDVAILTLLPVFLTITGKDRKFKEKVFGSVLIIIAANLGSSIMPFGNPQNLFLYSSYQLDFTTFLSWMLPFFLLSIGLILLLSLKVSKKSLALTYQSRKNFSGRQLMLPICGMVLMLSMILGFLPYFIVLPIVILLIAVADRAAFMRVDYRLLFTFAFFFLIVGNLSSSDFFVELIQGIFVDKASVLAGSALISQLISNVPAAILIAPFTQQARAVLLGVNIGGLGTLVASLANLIGFKVFCLYLPQLKGKFFTRFSLLNFLLLALYLIVFLLII